MSSSKKPLKKEGVKSSSKKPLKKRGGTGGTQSALAALNRKNAKTYALAERLQGTSPPKSALSVIHARTPLENPPLEKPQSAKTVNGDSLMRLIKILHRTKKSKKSKEP